MRHFTAVPLGLKAFAGRPAISALEAVRKSRNSIAFLSLRAKTPSEMIAASMGLRAAAHPADMLLRTDGRNHFDVLVVGGAETGKEWGAKSGNSGVIRGVSLAGRVYFAFSRSSALKTCSTKSVTGCSSAIAMRTAWVSVRLCAFARSI